ncbi:hypothetical protein RIF29_27901 [Crotalaria pallida]|uniref:Uncharacterized protein n=1 Tax=Crotalaria pallida TaxID=3830 RepID=A0AAN9EPY1_CROPI
MLPNLDLILLSFLHASFISFVLLIAIFIILLALLFAFSLALLSISLYDLHHFCSEICEYFIIVKGDLQLGMALILVSLVHQAVNFFFVSKPWPKRKVDEFEVIKAQQFSPISSIYMS